MLTHGNVVQNLRHLRRACGYDDDCISVTWLPHFHDFGLVEGLLSPIYGDIPCYVLSPLAVWTSGALAGGDHPLPGDDQRRPELRLRAVRRTASAGGTRGRSTCRSWRVAFNGAEPVRAETLERFAAAFAPYGFRREASTPATAWPRRRLSRGGRAEARRRSYAVDAAALERRTAAGGRGAPTRRRRALRRRHLVGCGRPGRAAGGDRRSRDARRAPPGRVGEIWVAGPSVARGYWGRPEETETTFRARLAGGAAEGRSCAPATSASSATASCLSPAASRTSSSCAAATTIRRTSR